MSKIIAIEGIDGAGKATQAERLAKAINAQVFSFPNYLSDSGKILRQHLVGAWSSIFAAGRQPEGFGICGVCEREDIPMLESGALAPHYDHPSGLLSDHTTKLNMIIRQSLMTINRYESMNEIKQTLESGKNVVFDRWWLSSLVYGVDEGVDRDWLIKISSALVQPDFWIYIDVPGVIGGGRRPPRDNNERDVPKLERVRQNYLNEFANIPNGVVIDGTASVDEVTNQINKAVIQRFGSTWSILHSERFCPGCPACDDLMSCCGCRHQLPPEAHQHIHGPMCDGSGYVRR